MDFDFCCRGNHFQQTIQFFVCSEFIHIQCDFTCTCVVACFHTFVDVSQQMQTHSRQTHTQTTYRAQTHHTFIPTVVVSLMIHDNMYVYLYVHVYVYVYVYVHVLKDICCVSDCSGFQVGCGFRLFLFFCGSPWLLCSCVRSVVR